MSQSEKKNISREDSNIIKNIFNKKTKQRTNYLKNNEKEVKTIKLSFKNVLQAQQVLGYIEVLIQEKGLNF